MALVVIKNGLLNAKSHINLTCAKLYDMVHTINTATRIYQSNLTSGDHTWPQLANEIYILYNKKNTRQNHSVPFVCAFY